MSDFAVIIILMVGSFILFIALAMCCLIFFLQHRVRKNIWNKRLATILTPSGDREDKLLPKNFNELTDKDKETREEITYFIRPDKSFKTWWPFGRPRILQVAINSYLYRERNPEPIDPFDRPPIMDGLLLKNLKNINFSRAMVGRSEEIVQELGRKEKKKIPIWLFVVLGVALIGIILVITLVFGGA